MAHIDSMVSAPKLEPDLELALIDQNCSNGLGTTKSGFVFILDYGPFYDPVDEIITDRIDVMDCTKSSKIKESENLINYSCFQMLDNPCDFKQTKFDKILSETLLTLENWSYAADSEYCSRKNSESDLNQETIEELKSVAMKCTGIPFKEQIEFIKNNALKSTLTTKEILAAAFQN